MCCKKYDILNKHTKFLHPEKQAKETMNRFNIDRKCYEENIFDDTKF